MIEIHRMHLADTSSQLTKQALPENIQTLPVLQKQNKILDFYSKSGSRSTLRTAKPWVDCTLPENVTTIGWVVFETCFWKIPKISGFMILIQISFEECWATVRMYNPDPVYHFQVFSPDRDTSAFALALALGMGGCIIIDFRPSHDLLHLNDLPS